MWGKLAQLKIFTCYLRGKLLFPAITRRLLTSAASRCRGSEIANSAVKYPSSFLLNSKNHPISPIVPPYFKSVNERALIWALLTYQLCLFVESESGSSVYQVDSLRQTDSSLKEPRHSTPEPSILPWRLVH